eukprot:m.258214 g.258214  ORF g.258214 m.258214 type:complete len:233 (+) comp36283_c0_seq1:166-864(+)
MSSSLIFRQLFDKETSTYTYLLGDSASKEAILIDPVKEKVARDVALIKELGLTLKYALNTHCHADHVTGTGDLKKQVGCKSIIAKNSGAKADILLNDNDLVKFGSRHVVGMSTPGHTEGCFTYVLDDKSKCFCGDTLFVRGCGRTDFQGGSSSNLYDSVHTRIFTLPDDCAVFPAHDYKGHTQSTVGEEKVYNPRLTKTKPEFEELMANLNLSKPGKIDIAVPRNLVCDYIE